MQKPALFGLRHLMKLLQTCLILFAAAAPSAAQAGNAKDEAAIRELVAKYVAAREQSDQKAIADLFTSDADQLVSTGDWRKGRNDVVRGTLASSRASSGRRTIAVESIRFVTNDVALADGRYEIAGTGGSQARRMWTTLVLSRTPSGWRIAAIRNMLPAP